MRVASVMAFAAAFGSAAGAQTSPQVDPQKVVADVRHIIAANYVLADVRPKLDAALAEGLAAHRYDVSDPNMLAERINADMAAVAHDKHLSMRFDPAEQANLARRPDGAGADD